MSQMYGTETVLGAEDRGKKIGQYMIVQQT